MVYVFNYEDQITQTCYIDLIIYDGKTNGYPKKKKGRKNIFFVFMFLFIIFPPSS